MRTQVAIIGAGPAGLLLAHLLRRSGVDSVVLETRSQQHVAARIRAGILERSSVQLLESADLAGRLKTQGYEHRGIHPQWPGERHHLDFVDPTGRSVWVYGQTEVQMDLVAAAEADGQPVLYGVIGTALHDGAFAGDRAVADGHSVKRRRLAAASARPSRPRHDR